MRIFYLSLLSLSAALGQTWRTVPLDPAGMKLVHVKVEKVTYKGKAAVRMLDDGSPKEADGSHYAILSGTDFGDGAIEIDMAGDRRPGAPEAVRGFTGLAFRMARDGRSYECFYLRPLNGRSEDQVQRNHSAQYISNPEFGWRKLREETPGKYETYVDLVPGEWNHVRIEAKGDKARLYVNGALQPTLIVNDLKHGVSKGPLALWMDQGVISHFANLRISQ